MEFVHTKSVVEKIFSCNETFGAFGVPKNFNMQLSF